MVTEKHPREKMMVQDLDVIRQALRIENQEAEQLWSCHYAVETALAVADRGTAMAEATAG